MAAPSPSFYKVGGSLRFDHPSYVTRKADLDLMAGLKAQQFCYVFNCRQMGKSSLRVRSMRLLREAGMLCAAIDMTLLGSDVTAQQWYGGLITQLFQGFSLFAKVDLKSWLHEHQSLAPVQQLSRFISEVVLPQTGDRSLYIFIDEIDKILSLPFPVDDFFALIRYFYNQRAEDLAYQRITVALFGVATPSDLIQDKTQTLFNIGQAIELTGFSPEEAAPLTLGLQDYCDHPRAVLDAILSWTGGQPFLTQKLCQMILQGERFIASGQEEKTVQAIVQSRMIEHWETQDIPVHFKTIRDRILRPSPLMVPQLILYQQLLQQQDVHSSSRAEITELRLSGLVVQRGAKLHIYNPIYARIFDRAWVQTELEKIRPYAESICAWEESNRQDESRLLRGKALQDAIRWSESKNLSHQDYQFLAASRDLDKRTAVAQERRRQDVERLELELIAEQKAKAALSSAYQKAQQRLKTASVILVTSVIGAAISTGWLGYVLQREQETQVESLQWAGKGALSQFEFNQVEGLITAMEASQQLLSQVKSDQPIENYPTRAPIDALETILDHIHERNHLDGHQGPINSVSVSPNGQYIATASRDGTVKIWTSQGKELQTLPSKDGYVYGTSFSSDNQLLATGGNDGKVKIWTIHGKLLHTLNQNSEVYSVQFSPNGMWLGTASQDGTIRLWDRNGKEVTTFQAHEQAIYSIEFSADSETILSASQDGSAKLWRRDGTLIQSLPGSDALYSASFSPNGREFFTAGRSGTIKIWKNNQLTQTLQGHQAAIYDLSFDPSGQFFVTTSADKTVKVWDMSGKLIQTLQGHQGAVYDASFSLEHPHLLVTVSHDAAAKVWDLSQSRSARSLSSQAEVAALALAPGDTLITAYAGGMVKISSPDDNQAHRFQARGSSIYDVSYHAQQNQLYLAYKDGQVEVRDITGKPLQVFQAHQDIIYSLATHPSTDLIATVSRDKTLKLWTSRGQIKQTIKAHSGAVYDVKFSPDQQWLATASNDKTAKIWKLNGTLHRELKGHQGEIHHVAFSPDSQHLITVSADKTARLWNLNGEELLRLEHDTSLIFRVSFSPDGKQIATGTKDGSIYLWNRSGELIDQIQGHRSLVMDLEFRHNNQLISIGQDDREATQWPRFSSASQRLESLLNQGCDWLQDYLKQHPEKRPESCSL